MCRLLETIRIEDRKIINLEYHNRRFNSSRQEKFGIRTEEDLGKFISLPEDLETGVYRCRVIYGKEIDKIEFIKHSPFEVSSLKLVEWDDIDYSLKYADRSLLSALLEKRGDCDEILIVKHGFITDTSISNIVFQSTNGDWLTPDTPLLKGTMRMKLLESGQITEAAIRPEDLKKYSGAKMINCMMEPESSPMIPIENIKT